jgi:hypothetical protein
MSVVKEVSQVNMGETKGLYTCGVRLSVGIPWQPCIIIHVYTIT